MGILDFATRAALNKFKDSAINPRLEGVATVEDISYKDKKLTLRCVLEGFPAVPIDIVCEDISFAPDGSSVIVGKFASNAAFAHNALARFVAGKPFPIPEGAARLGAMAAKKVLGL